MGLKVKSTGEGQKSKSKDELDPSSSTVFSARCNIYISRLCHDASPSVRLFVTEVHWRIRPPIANLGFKFRYHFTAHCAVPYCVLAVLLAGGSSRAMLASARLSCLVC